jgi:poly-gamma-glutamate synthesis protein (capsule biosynthesis protein)
MTLFFRNSFALSHVLPKSRLGLALVLSGIWMLLTGCNLTQSPSNRLESPVTASPSSSPQPQPYIKEAQLIAVGDIMMHGSQIRSGYNSTTQTYNYDNFFTQVKGILSQGNWVIANLETPLAGAEARYTGYPLFNAPDALADAIKGAGFNILTTANNHALDRVHPTFAMSKSA